MDYEAEINKILTELNKLSKKKYFLWNCYENKWRIAEEVERGCSIITPTLLIDDLLPHAKTLLSYAQAEVRKY